MRDHRDASFPGELAAWPPPGRRPRSRAAVAPAHCWTMPDGYVEPLSVGTLGPPRPTVDDGVAPHGARCGYCDALMFCGERGGARACCASLLLRRGNGPQHLNG
eukprot:gene1988-7279_t